MKSQETLAIWHKCIEERDMSLLDSILHDDVVFYSPVIFRPQHGKALTSMYLQGASMVLNKKTFVYTKEVVNENHLFLEFECTVDDILINGIDMITLNDDGKIIEFKVMMRPMKAIFLMKEKMAALLEAMKS